MPAISASEAISPALERAKQICFRPFKLSRWLKLAVVTLFTGEVATSSCNFGVPTNVSNTNPGPVYTPLPGMGGIEGVLHAFPVILLALAFIVLLGVFVLVVSYLWCQFRLTLIDTVLTGECRVRESWDKYGNAGMRMFGFYLLIAMLVTASAVPLLVLPLMSAARSGVSRQSGGLAYLLGVGAISLFIFVIVVVFFWIVVVFLKDFVAPILALEDLSIGEAWGRLKAIAAQEPGAFVVYILLKIVLAIASGIIFGIIFFVVVLAILIPTIIVAVAIGVTFKAQLQTLGAFFSVMTAAKIALIATAAIVFIGVIAYFIAFISVPAAIFFQSYALYFLGSRYEPLRVLLIPQPSRAPYPIVPPQAPPDFIPPHSGPETA